MQPRKYSIIDKQAEYQLGPMICHKRKEVTERIEVVSEYGYKTWETRGTGKFELMPVDASELSSNP